MTQVTMVLASAPGLPNGSVQDRLVLNLGLTRQGELDEAAYEADPEPWTTLRNTPDGQVYRGELIRADKGWALRGEDGEDAPLWQFTGRIFRPGEYVTILTAHGAELVWRIVAVEAPALAGAPRI